MLGVCLGHQAIGQVFGGVVRRGPVPMHGKVSTVHTDGKGLFEGLPGSFEITRYHSLVVGDERWPTILEKTAWTDDRSEEHTYELKSLMRISYAVFCLKKKK